MIIPEPLHPTVRSLWPAVGQACAQAGGDRLQASLVLTIAWLEHGLDVNAAQLERIAVHVHRLLHTLAMPRLIFAAWQAGTAAVVNAGERVPDNADTQRFVRDGMAVFHWLLAHLDGILLDNYQPTTPLSPTPGASAHSRLIVPVPGTTRVNNHSYALDSGVDLLVPAGSPVVAAAAGVVVRSTADSVWLALDEALQYGKAVYPLLCYRHLSRVDCWPRLHVQQGALLGTSGVRPGGRVPYLHLGIVSDFQETDYVRPFQLAALFGWA